MYKSNYKKHKYSCDKAILNSILGIIEKDKKAVLETNFRYIEYLKIFNLFPTLCYMNTLHYIGKYFDVLLEVSQTEELDYGYALEEIMEIVFSKVLILQKSEDDLHMVEILVIMYNQMINMIIEISNIYFTHLETLDNG